MKVLVAGGSGFIGRRIADELAQRGLDVLIGTRRPSRQTDGRDVRIEAQQLRSFEHATEGVTHAINCIMGKPADMVAATRNLMQAAKTHKLHRVIHFSSVAVYGTQTGQIDEAAELAASDWYGGAKAACEKVVAMYPEVPTVTLRPALVGGLGSSLWSTRIARMLAARRLGELGDRGDGWCNMIHVGDVARSAVLALSKEGIEGRAINLAPLHPTTWNTYLTLLAKAIGATPIERISSYRLAAETKLFAPILRGLEISSRKLRAPSPPPPITPSLCKLFSLRARYGTESGEDLMGKESASIAAIVDEVAEGFLA